MDTKHLIVTEDGPTLWVTLNRPDRLNALNRALVDELRDLFTALYWRMLTGRFIGAAEGKALGLIARIVERDALEAEARAYLKDMLHATPLGLRLTKEALNHAIDAGSLEAAVAMEDRNQILCAMSGDFREGVAAFLEKREPRYS